jgi:hypothetical protein
MLFLSLSLLSSSPSGLPRIASSTTCRAATSQATLPKALAEAHDKAVELFQAIEARGGEAFDYLMPARLMPPLKNQCCCCCADLLTPGSTESEINEEIFELCAAEFGTRKHWHKRLVRVGANTIHPIYVDTPDLTLQADDIAFIDLGPVFEDIEADFARTYVIGMPLIFCTCHPPACSRSLFPCMRAR